MLSVRAARASQYKLMEFYTLPFIYSFVCLAWNSAHIVILFAMSEIQFYTFVCWRFAERRTSQRGLRVWRAHRHVHQRGENCPCGNHNQFTQKGTQQLHPLKTVNMTSFLKKVSVERKLQVALLREFSQLPNDG